MSVNDFNQKEIEFVQVDIEEEVFHSKDLIQLYPLGISLAHDVQKPFLLFRDEKSEVTLPVALSQLEAGIYVAQGQDALASPHGFLEEILKSFNIELRQCVFVQVQPDSQMVRIYFSGHPMMNSIKLRADQIISLCLQFNVPFYASREFIQKSALIQAKPHIKSFLENSHSLLVDRPQKYLV